MTGANLRWLRKRVSMSIEELAGILNEDIQDIDLWEAGETEPGKASFLGLCSFFELDKSTILLLDLSQSDLFTSKKRASVQKKVIAMKRQGIV
jgi:transcriptional regulator with XRE-family HTH domain